MDTEDNQICSKRENDKEILSIIWENVEDMKHWGLRPFRPFLYQIWVDDDRWCKAKFLLELSSSRLMI